MAPKPKSTSRESMVQALEERCVPEPNSGCWLWVGPINDQRGGYGSFNCGHVRGKRAHRISWQLFRGPLTADEHILHACDMPCCVNPDHLFKGDQQINMADKVAKRRQLSGERNGTAVLTEAQAMTVLKDGRRTCDIAREYGVSPETVGHIRRGRTWKHLPRPIGIRRPA